MSAIAESATAEPAVPSAAARAMVERLIEFPTVSRDSNLALIEWVRDYLTKAGREHPAHVRCQRQESQLVRHAGRFRRSPG